MVDNNGKDLEVVGPVIEYAQRVSALQFLFVSSAGIYKTSAEPPHVEGDAIKEDSGHAQVEEYLRHSGLAWSSFRPQYLTGAPPRGPPPPPEGWAPCASLSAAHNVRAYRAERSAPPPARRRRAQATAATRTARSGSSSASPAAARCPSLGPACSSPRLRTSRTWRR